MFGVEGTMVFLFKRQHKWKLVRAKESEGEETEGERKARAHKGNLLEGWLWLFNLRGTAVKLTVWSLGCFRH